MSKKLTNIEILTQIINFSSQPLDWCSYELYLKMPNSEAPIKEGTYKLILKTFTNRHEPLSKFDVYSIASMLNTIK